MHDQSALNKRSKVYALKRDPSTKRVYLYDGHKQLLTFDAHILPILPETVNSWSTVGYTEDMGPWRKGEFTTVPGWHLFLADPYVGPVIALLHRGITTKAPIVSTLVMKTAYLCLCPHTLRP